MHRSLPSRERGLKFHYLNHIIRTVNVAPLAGAWIEIFLSQEAPDQCCLVAPLAGAWIEIYLKSSDTEKSVSLPSRERGLKST